VKTRRGFVVGRSRPCTFGLTCLSLFAHVPKFTSYSDRLLYSDYLISSFGQTTATGLSALLHGEISHDSVQRSLASERKTSSDLWRTVKPHVREIESEDGALIVDDSIAEKPYTDENEIICWHYDHSQQRNVKGINFVTCLYHNRNVSLPIGFELVYKTERYTDPKDGKEKRR